MKNGIIIIVLLISGFAFSQTTINLENQCNCEVIKGTDVTAPGVTFYPADLGDIYINTDTGILYFWDGDSWELTSGNIVTNKEFEVDTENKQLVITDSDGGQVHVSFDEIADAIDKDEQDLANVLGEGADANGIVITNLGIPTANQDAATKSYVDGAITASNQTIVSGDDDNDVEVGSDGGAFYDDAVLQSGVAANTTNITTNTEDILTNKAAITTNATDITNLGTRVTTNETNITSNTTSIGTNADAIALKEDASNKSADVTLADDTNTKFPTELAVKTYVDGAITASNQTIVSGDDDNDVEVGSDGGAFYDDAVLQSGVAANTTNITTNTEDILTNKAAITTNATDITNLGTRVTTNETNITSNTTSIGTNADAIAAVQSDVDANEIAATDAIAAVQSDVDTNKAAADAGILANTNALAAHESADEDLSATNEIQDLELTGDKLKITNNSAASEIDLSGYISSDDQDLGTASLDGTTNTLSIGIENGKGTSVDLSLLEESSEIAAVQSDVDANETAATNAIAAVQSDVDTNKAAADAGILANTNALAAHESADEDLSATNEIQDLELTGDKLKITNNSAASEIDLSGYISSDDQDLGTASLDGTTNTLSIGIENGKGTSVDLSLLEESSEIAAVQSDVDANETAATNAIAAVQSDVDTNKAAADAGILANTNALAAHESADEDLSATNEIQTLTSTDGSITVTPDSEGKDYDFSIDLSGVNTDNQNLESATLSGTDLTISIEDGASAIANLSSLEESSEIAAVQSDVDANEAAATNAIAAVQSDVDTNKAAADAGILANTNALAAHESADEDLSATNEIQDLELTGDKLKITNNSAASEIDLSGYISSDDQDLGTASLDGTTNTLSIGIENGKGTSVDLSLLEESSEIAAVQSDVDANEIAATDAIAAVQSDVDANEAAATNAIAAVQSDVDTNKAAADAGILANTNALAAHESADEDLSATNEIQDLELTGDKLKITNNSAASEIDLSGYISSDDQDLGTASLDGTTNTLSIGIENGKGTSVDLSLLEESSEIAAVQSDVDANEAAATNAIAAVQSDVDANETAATNAIAAVQSDVDTNKAAADAGILANTNALAAHESADEDLSATNEIQDLELTGDKLKITNNSAASEIDLSGYISSDDQDLGTASLDGTTNTLSIGIENGKGTSVDLSLLEESSEIAAVQSDVDANEIAATNAIAAVQSDVDANEIAATNAIAAVQSDVDTNKAAADAGILANTNALAAHESADEDLSVTNEIQTLTSTDGSITVTPDSEGKDYDFSIDLSGVNTDNQNLESATLSGTDLTISIEDGASAIANLSSLEESSEIAAVQSDVDANEIAATDAIAAVQSDVDANEAAATNAIAAVQSDVDANETAADAGILANTNALAAHESADEDLSATNEIQDLELTGDKLRITNNSAASEIDLSGYISSDDQDLGTASLDGTTNTLSIGIENGKGTSVDLSLLEESSEIAAVQSDVDANEAAATNAIAAVQSDVDTNKAAADAGILANTNALAAHESADEDLSATNEIQDLELTGDKLRITNNSAASEIDLSGYISSDDQDLGTASLDGTTNTLSIGIENGKGTSVDLSLLEESSEIAAVQSDVDANETAATNAIAAVQSDVDTNKAATDAGILANTNALAAHESADEDLSATNEIQTLTSTDGSVVATKDADNNYDLSVDASSTQFTSSEGLTATNVQSAIDEVAAGSSDDQTASEVDYSNRTSGLTAENTQAAIDELAASNAADGDTDDENELNTTFGVNGTNLELVDAGGTLQVALSDLGSDDQTASEVDYSNSTSGLTAGNTQAAIDELAASNAADGDTDDENELNTTFGVNGTNLELVDAGGTLQVALSDLGSDDQTASEVDYSNSTSGLTAGNTQAAIDELAASNAADGDTDDENELNTTFGVNGTNLELVDAGGALQVALSDLGSDDQTASEVDYSNSTSGLTAENTQAAIDELAASNAADGDTDDENELNTTFGVNGTNLELVDAGGTLQVALSDLGSDDQTASEVDYSNSTSGLTAENTQAAIDELAASNAADGDTDDENEIQALTSTDGSITVTPDSEGKDYDFSIDLSGVNTDDQALSLSGNDLVLEDGGSVNLSGYLDNTDDQGLSLATGNILTLEDGGTVDLTPYLDNTDDQTATEVTFSPAGNVSSNNVQDAIEEVQIDLDAAKTAANNSIDDLQSQIDANETAIDNHISADEDTNSTNELQDLNLTANVLTLSTPKTTENQIDLSGYIDNTDEQELAITGNTLSISNGNSIILPTPDGSETLIKNGTTTTVSGTGVSGGEYQIEVADAAITNAKLADDAVTTDKILLHAVTDSKIADGAVNGYKISNLAVEAKHINQEVAGVGLTKNPTSGALDVDIASINGDGDITSNDLTVTGGANATFNNVTLEIAEGVVTSTEIKDETIATADIADEAITTAKIKNGTANQILTTNAAGDGVEWKEQTASSISLDTELDVDGDGTNETNTNEAISAMSKVTAKAARIFYPPSIALNASAVSTGNTRDLHEDYVSQYGSPMVSSTSAPSSGIPTYGEDELYYYVTYYDTDVFENVSISDTGVLSYDIKAVPSDYNSLINVVFVVK